MSRVLDFCIKLTTKDRKMDYFPIFLNIRDQACLVVGGGDVAARKASLLAKAGAKITVVSPELGPELAEELAKGQIRYVCDVFRPPHLDDAVLVIAATDHLDVNQQVATAARQRKLPVNVVDQPELCSFIMPAIIDRSPVVMAISTGGGVPVLARLIRGKLEAMIPSTYGDLAQLATDFRDRVKAKFTDIQSRRIFWEDILQGPIAESVFAGQIEPARAALGKALEAADATPLTKGEVYLVGGGPGNPDLLTFRALRLMQQADVVCYDALVAPAIVDLCRRDADRIYVGKQSSNHALPQDDINLLLVKLAKEGKRVLRLKGGDPFIFGRGGEEIETLAEHGIPFQVVPGITSAQGASSYAGIPLTHRDYSQSCVFVTGHRREGSDDLNWNMLVSPDQTVVIYMGIGQLPEIVDKLLQHGRAADTPVAIVEKATRPDQRVIISTLAELPETAQREQAKAPALIVVGDVVKLHGKLNWFGKNSI